jgi:hypothetical protein
VSRGTGMNIDIAAALVKRVQNSICLSGQEELLEHVALALTEQEFDELCADYQYSREQKHAVLTPRGLMLILGMPVLIRTMK